MDTHGPPQVLKERYQLVTHLGTGGMAMVYRAHDNTLERDVAIKFLSPDQVADDEARERFLREARTVARLSHPNIMTLYDMGIESDWPYLVLEYIPGTNLHQMLVETNGPLSIAESLRVINDVLSALAYAHGQGLIHRDIKPDNIMITPEGHIKLADFGLALGQEDVRLTRDDAVVGTALYMAPESAASGQFDQRSDLYAVGAVLYELLTGRPPYSGETALQILTNALQNPLTPPSLVNPGIPTEIEDVVVRLLSREPEQRYPTAESVRAALPDPAEIERLMAEEVKRATSDRLSRTLLERIVRSTTTQSRIQIEQDSDTGDALIQMSPAGEPEPLAQDLLVYAAQEDTIEAVEAERRRMARLLQDTVINQLNLLLSQANVYEQTITNPQAQMAISVMVTLVRQTVQQARDLESHLHPTILESLGLEPALESLANQEKRAQGVYITLALQRMRERLPPQLELALFRATQEAIDRSIRQAQSQQMAIRLEKRENEIFFSIADDGLMPSGEVLRATRQRIEGMGGSMSLQSSSYGGLELVIRFKIEAPVELTERELDVIKLVAEGLSNKEIAALLYISPRTVKFHLDNIYSKLAVNTRTEAAIYALRRGWVRANAGQPD